jgi:hypothetical protein
MTSHSLSPLETGANGTLTGAGEAVQPLDPMSEKNLSPPAADANARPHHIDGSQHPLAQLSSVRKHFLLFVFSIASFLDICNVSGVAVAVAQISVDIGLGASQIVWVRQGYFYIHIRRDTASGRKLFTRVQ